MANRTRVRLAGASVARMQIRMAPNVTEALARGRAVVALESTLIAHGLPRPGNLEMAERIEQRAAASGAQPATVASASTITAAKTRSDRVRTRSSAARTSARCARSSADCRCSSMRRATSPASRGRAPREGGSGSPNPHLCGAGVAFKLAWGVGQARSGAAKVSETFRRFLVEATALAALGTIADVVPLVGENRNLAHFGLGGLKQSELTGIKALIESAGLTPAEDARSGFFQLCWATGLLLAVLTVVRALADPEALRPVARVVQRAAQLAHPNAVHT